MVEKNNSKLFSVHINTIAHVHTNRHTDRHGDTWGGDGKRKEGGERRQGRKCSTDDSMSQWEEEHARELMRVTLVLLLRNI